MPSLKDLFTPAYNLDPETKASLRKWAIRIGIAVVVLVIFLGGWQAGSKANADAPLWEAVIFARLFLMRLVAASALLVLLLAFVNVAFNAKDNTKLGERLWIFKEDDPDWLKTVKVRNAAFAYCSILISGALVLAQVLR